MPSRVTLFYLKWIRGRWTIRKYMSTILITACLAGLLTSVDSTFACPGAQKFEYSYFAKADVIFRGKIDRYEKTSSNHAEIGFFVVQTLLGREQKHWTALWINSTYGVPENWIGPVDVIVGLTKLPDEGGQLVRMEVLQKACSSPNIVSDTAANLANIRRSGVVFPEN
jgi:hypothetical protein